VLGAVKRLGGSLFEPATSTPWWPYAVIGVALFMVAALAAVALGLTVRRPAA
jgi:hypothetical protein